MMKKLQKYGITIVIIILSLSFIVYKKVFIRDENTRNRMVRQVGNEINPVPYTDYFYAQQQRPSAFFTTPAFPSYTKRCHENKELCSVLPVQQMYADIQWIGSIQFVGAQDIPNKNLGLSKLLENLTNLAPYRDYPYAFGQLLVPMAKKASASQSLEIVEQSREDAKELADKGEYYICNPAIIAKIDTLNESNFVNTFYSTGNEQYRNPCPTYERSHYAAFNAFYFRKDVNDSARNYKISSFTDGSPGLAPIMAALVYGRGGEHIKSASIRYDKYVSLASKADMNDEIIQKEVDESFKKAVFELQLQIITDADNDSNKVCKNSYDCLQKDGYIKKSVEKSYNDICKQGKVTENLRCVLLMAGIQNKWIGLDGMLKYPINDNFVYARSTDYDSRWIKGIN